MNTQYSGSDFKYKLVSIGHTYTHVPISWTDLGQTTWKPLYLCLTLCRRKNCGPCFLTWKSGSPPFLVVSMSMEWWAITFAFNTFSFSFLCSVMEVRGIRVNCGKLLHYADLLKVEVNTLWSTAKPVCFPQSWRERREKVKNMNTLNNLMTTSK